MLMQQLYRYLLGPWDNLTEVEIQEIPKFFEDVIDNDALKSAIKAIRAEKLHEKLYETKFSAGQDTTPNNKTIIEAFDNYNNTYHYFQEHGKKRTIKDYKAIYFLCMLVANLSPKDASYVTNPYESAYIILTLFGGEQDIEQSFKLFDTYCQENNLQPNQDVFKDNSDFSLRQGEKKISLPEWQKIIREGGIAGTRSLFNMAHKIEHQLGRAPASLIEAREAAKALAGYKRQDERPDFAAFCITNAIPEELFNQFLSENLEESTKAQLSMLEQLSSELIADFINQLLSMGVDFAKIGNLMKSFKEEDQLTCIARFKENILSHIRTYDNFCEFLALFSTLTSKKQFISIFPIEKINAFIPEYSDLCSLIKSFPSEYQHEFSDTVIKPAANRLINDFVKYLYLLKSTLPQTGQVLYLNALFSAEKIQSITEIYSAFKMQVAAILPDERLNYIRVFFDKAKLKSLFANDYKALDETLKSLNTSERMTLLVDVIGINEIRTIASSRLYVQSITTLLPSAQQPLFLDMLSPIEEKVAKEKVLATKQKIIDINFALGVLGSGWGGQEIVLAQNNKKLVPSTVAKHWEFINDAEKAQISYVDAWEKIQQSSLEVKENSSTLSYFSRSTEAYLYYKSLRPSQQSPIPEQKPTGW